MLPLIWQNRFRAIAEGVVAPLARMGVSPNAVTVAGFLFNVVTAVVLAVGHLSIGGALLFLAGLLDMLDGALARTTKQQSDFGAFLDSLLDRYSEAAILLALIVVFALRHDTLVVVLVYVVAAGSLLISYARSRAESLGIECKVGIAPRPERIIILGLGLLFTTQTTIGALIILATLTHVTAMQRLYHVWRVTNGQNQETHSERGDQVQPG